MLNCLLICFAFNVTVHTEEGNWIHPVEWERAAEELTWERVRTSAVTDYSDSSFTSL